ncbi:GIY-YIG nuclease family protein [Desulfoluna spongiiphila]|uniref:T5orf172 domain-containing protein n=1 Tax=Desulfoluna spongiiphila TaxID=419481 RepID=A0A1G5CGW2_9BACT|nr:GIY-YIG nuclease family protein [Desulfoluna spongiiphila]SCY01551.1 T5orf172 domain-containing protein [Desulfoluna spongiiphila]
MIDFEKEMDAILQGDPLGILQIKPKVSSAITADERLISSFEEINDFIREHGCEPEASRDIRERSLYSRLKGLRESPEKAISLKSLDTFGLLSSVIAKAEKEIKTIDDVLGDDALGLLGGDDTVGVDDSDIFNLRNVPETIEMPDKIARRKRCKDFADFESLFKQCHGDLKSGKKEFRKFTGEQQITPGLFFILNGVMVYVSEVGRREMKRGKTNARLRCIFENGTESNMLLRSLATELYKDENGRRVVDPYSDLFTEIDQVNESDDATGYIYVLKSLSDDPQIRGVENLYKIGFSSQPVENRIKNAAKEPTYLMADVAIVTEFQTYNLNPQKMELLLHTFFAEACLNLDVFDGEGRRYAPREWFVVPLHVIETAAQLLVNGEIINYRYDSLNHVIVEK